MRTALVLLAAIFLAQASNSSVTPPSPLPPISIPAIPQIETKDKLQLADYTSFKEPSESNPINAAKEGWSDKGWAFVSGLALGWIGSLITQWIERRGDGARLASMCFLTFREVSRQICQFSHPSQFADAHAEIVGRLQSAVTGRLEWLRGKKQQRAANAWDSFRDFTSQGCNDATGYDDESVLARFKNQHAESVKERFLRLLSDLDAALK